ncbi:MAG: 30S ribosome-binding factor RbfA [Deltaproteobacteria bacterium]|nr:30S ribosome-binding factor RbfA [Deltaproteobacteria bacterium]
MPSRRPERVSGVLLEAVAEVLLREVKDPRVSGVTLTGAAVSPDLKVAKVFFTTRQAEEQAEALAGLRSATGYIKRQIAGRLRLRHTPDLQFLYDATLEKANRLESLLRQVEEKER